MIFFWLACFLLIPVEIAAASTSTFPFSSSPLSAGLMLVQSSLTRLYDLLLVATVLSVSNAFVVPLPAIASKPPASSSTLFGGLRGVETFDGAFTLSPESEGVLVGYMECEVSRHALVP